MFLDLFIRCNMDVGIVGLDYSVPPYRNVLLPAESSIVLLRRGAEIKVETGAVGEQLQAL